MSEFIFEKEIIMNREYAFTPRPYIQDGIYVTVQYTHGIETSLDYVEYGPFADVEALDVWLDRFDEARVAIAAYNKRKPWQDNPEIEEHIASYNDLTRDSLANDERLATMSIKSIVASTFNGKVFDVTFKFNYTEN